MRDRYAVVWTRLASGPIKMGNLVATRNENRFSYTDEFLNSDHTSGLSLLSHPKLINENAVVHRATEILPLYPRLMALIPGKSRNNMQRRLYTKILAKQEPPPAPGFDTEWELLMLAGRNGIGHIDVFVDDRQAEEWYMRAHNDTVIAGNRSEFWSTIKDDIYDITQQTDFDVLAFLGPTPSVGGMIPKMLVSIPDDDSWDGTVAPPGHNDPGGKAYKDVVLKIEYPEYAGLTSLEILCLDVHKRLGFDVPRYWRNQIDGMNLFAIERFDRTAEGLPIALESFFSVLASGKKEVQTPSDTEMESVGQMLKRLSLVVNLAAKTAQKEVFQRFCVAVLTGNGDLHMENLSFLGGADDVKVAPVYDPAPMRAWPQHNLLSALPFTIELEDATIGDSIVRLGSHFGLTRDEAAYSLTHAKDATEGYMQQVMELQEVPLLTRERLVAIIKSVRSKTTISKNDSVVSVDVAVKTS